jgi:hypothetical protein
MPEAPTAPIPSARWRAGAAALAALAAGLFVTALYAHQTLHVISDWDPTFVGTQALLRGQSPYAAIQVPPWPNYLLYPLPALLLTAPFTLVPLPLARALFAAIGAAAFTWVITARGKWTLYFLISGAMLWAWIDVQWAPLLIAAALTPSLSWMLAVKPTLGLALWSAYPNRTAVIGGLLFVGICFLIRPGWVSEWLAAVAPTPHKAHLFRPGGFLLLLALLRWRRPEARLLVVLAVVPQTTALYETLPLALAARNKVEAGAFAVLTMAAHLLYLLGPQGAWPIGAEYQWWVMLALIYLPVLGAILLRPNGADEPLAESKTMRSRNASLPAA